MAYVNPEEHVYLADPEHREEAGTPAIIESIRAGLVFQLKAAVGTAAIREREESFITRAIERALKKCEGNILEAARRLKVGQATLYRKIRKFGIAKEEV